MTVHDLKVANSDLAQTVLGQISGARPWPEDSVAVRAQRAAAVAARHADAVDKEARFPVEAIAALKDERLLGILVPQNLGGEGAGHGDVAEVCHILGQACASTAMIFAMHQVKVACVVRHSRAGGWHDGFMSRAVDGQWLLASSTTEGKAGGDVRSSAAPVNASGDRITLDRDASVISYGLQADALVTTARRSSEASTSDQVLLVLEKADYSLTQTQTWDTLGMRGTCSVGFTLKAEADPAQVLSPPYETIHGQTMVPSAHLFWSSAWAGIAAASVERARRFVRKAARAAGGNLPPAASYLVKANTSLRALRALIHVNLAHYEAIQNDPAALSDMGFQSEINLLKVDASELAVVTVMSALRTCGLSGYRNDNESSLGRHLRDVLSSPVMINNDRILANLAAASLLAETPKTLR